VNRIEKLAAETSALFKELDLEIEQFQKHTGLHCKFGCGKCCLKPDIEAAILEFIPFALQVYREGNAVRWLEKISSGGSICVILDEHQPGQGHCSQYLYRGLICRLFGYSARRNKYDKKELVTCQIIKSESVEQFNRASDQINTSLEVPMITDYYARLKSIDPDLGSIFKPVNQTIRSAIELVENYMAYSKQEA
jgi:Fe-S-cluster containining protein